MMIFGYSMLPKDIRIGMGYENLNFVKKRKIFSIWVFKPYTVLPRLVRRRTIRLSSFLGGGRTNREGILTERAH